MNFKREDTVRWTSAAGIRDRVVIDVWDDEPKSLLLTDICRTTMNTFVALQCDCVVIESAGEPTVKNYRRRVREPKPAIKLDNKDMGDG